tara:strand:+ start:607 stop:816 length:210 start_codon:yes stop_codon:yes gene_type:complete
LINKLKTLKINNYDRIILKSDKEDVTKKLYKIMDANILSFKNKNNLSKYILALDTIKDKSFVTHYLLFL